MRLRINQVALIGTERQVSFLPGLNVIAGDVSTGKTGIFRLCRILLGARVRPNTLIREVREHIAQVGGRLTVGNQSVSVIRPLVSTTSAPVSVSVGDQVYRLPAARREGAVPSYSEWLATELGLPRLQVPIQPTRARTDADTSPLTMSDFLNYCVLTESGIDSDVFGHSDHDVDTKRRAVFRVVYGLYDVEAAEIEERLRGLSARISALRTDRILLERVLREAEIPSQSEIAAQLDDVTERLRQVGTANVALAANARLTTPPSEALLNEIRVTEADLDENQRAQTNEATALARLRELESELIAQATRLNRAIVAGDALVDFEFRRCPRCGSNVQQDRSEPGTCTLCMQPEPVTSDRTDLVRELERLDDQIDETRELIERSEETLASGGRLRQAYAERLTQLRDALNVLQAEFISEHASEIAESAAERARLEAARAQLTHNASLLARLSSSTDELLALEAERNDLEEDLEAHSGDQAITDELMTELDTKFAHILGELGDPLAHEQGRTYIRRDTFLPIAHDRQFAELSQGMKVLVNLAHALAHHEIALERQLILPGILLIDGMTDDLGGREELGRDRIDRIYRYLIDLSDRVGDDLQVILADHSVPSFAEPFVRLRLTREDPLVPLP